MYERGCIPLAVWETIECGGNASVDTRPAIAEQFMLRSRHALDGAQHGYSFSGNSTFAATNNLISILPDPGNYLVLHGSGSTAHLIAAQGNIDVTRAQGYVL